MTMTIDTEERTALTDKARRAHLRDVVFLDLIRQYDAAQEREGHNAGLAEGNRYELAEFLYNAAYEVFAGTAPSDRQSDD